MKLFGLIEINIIENDEDLREVVKDSTADFMDTATDTLEDARDILGGIKDGILSSLAYRLDKYKD